MPQTTAPFALVVDDDALILMQGCDILEEAGYRCHSAMDAEEAIATLTQHHESIMLLFSDVDLGQNGMNGFALARQVDARWPHVDIVIASGHFAPAADDMPAKATFISKPFTAQMVKEHLAETLPDGKKPEPLKNAV